MAEENGTDAEHEGTDPKVSDEVRAQIAKETNEATAKKIGWNPDFEGEDALDAETYIVKSREIQDTQRKQKKVAEHKLENLERHVYQIKDTLDKSYQRDIESAKSEIEALKKERRAAIKDADVDEVDVIDAKIDAANERTRAPEAEQPKPKKDHPDFTEWHEKNDWYLKDKDRTEYANNLHEEFMKDPEISALSYPRFLKKIEAAVKAEFDKKDPPPTPSGVEGAGTTVRGGNKKVLTVSDLPPDVKESMRRQIRIGAYDNEKDFIKEYQRFGT